MEGGFHAIDHSLLAGSGGEVPQGNGGGLGLGGGCVLLIYCIGRTSLVVIKPLCRDVARWFTVQDSR